MTEITDSAINGPDAGSEDDLRISLGRLRDLFGTAIRAAGRIQEALSGDTRPSREDVDMVASALREFDRVRNDIQRTGEADIVGVTTLGELAAALDQVMAARARARRVRTLERVQGPEILAELLAEVREAATAGVLDGLDALVDLIELSADPDAILFGADDAENRARAQLSDRWRPVIRAALSGRLRIAGESDGAATEVHGGGEPEAEVTDPRDGEHPTEGFDQPRVPPPARSEEQMSDQAQLLRRVAESLRADRGHAHETSTVEGILRDPVLALAWRNVIEVAPAGPEELIDYLRMAGEERGSLLGPDGLRAHGYGSLADVVQALRVVGALEQRADGILVCEPDLVAATRR